MSRIFFRKEYLQDFDTTKSELKENGIQLTAGSDGLYFELEENQFNKFINFLALRFTARKSDYMSIKEAAEYLRTSFSFLNNEVKTGKLKAFELGSKKKIVKKTDLENYLQKNLLEVSTNE